MAKKRMISDDLLNDDDFLDLSCEAFKLYVYLLVESDADGIVTGVNRIIKITQTEEKHLKELIDNNYVIQEPNNSKYAIVHFHVMNSMEKNSETNQNRYHPTKYLSFKNLLFVTLDSTLTLDDKEGFMPYGLYEGGAMANVLTDYEKQVELLKEQESRKESRKEPSDNEGLNDMELRLLEEAKKHKKDKD